MNEPEERPYAAEAALLRDSLEAIWGEHDARVYADHLAIHPKTMRRWLNGAERIPDNRFEQVIGLLHREETRLQALRHRVQKTLVERLPFVQREC